MMHILSSGERVRQMRRSFSAKWGPHVIADPVVNRTEGFFGDGGLGLNCTVKLSDLLVEQVHVARCSTLLLTEVWRHLRHRC